MLQWLVLYPFRRKPRCFSMTSKALHHLAPVDLSNLILSHSIADALCFSPSELLWIPCMHYALSSLYLPICCSLCSQVFLPHATHPRCSQLGDRYFSFKTYFRWHLFWKTLKVSFWCTLGWPLSKNLTQNITVLSSVSFSKLRAAGKLPLCPSYRCIHGTSYPVAA